MVATAAAAGTAVRCCRVHVCSYTRGPTYARSAAYRPRGTRTRTRTVEREVGESLEEGERREDGNRRLETPEARRRGSTGAKTSGQTPGRRRWWGSEKRRWGMKLQSRRNADHARLRPARKGEFSGRER